MKLQIAMLLTATTAALCTTTANISVEKEQGSRRLGSKLEGADQDRFQGAIQELNKLQNDLFQEQKMFRQQKEWLRTFLTSFDYSTVRENEEQAYEAKDLVNEMKNTEERMGEILLNLKSLREERVFFNSSSQNKSNLKELKRLSLPDIKKQLSGLSNIKKRRKSMGDTIKTTGVAFEEKVEQLWKLSEANATRPQFELEVKELQDSVKASAATFWNLGSE